VCGSVHAGGARTKIGLVHNFLRYEPLLPKALSAIYLQPLCEALEHVWATGLTIDFFRTGHFKWDSPWPHQSVEWQAEKLPGLDWIGLNYYGRCVLPPVNRGAQLQVHHHGVACQVKMQKPNLMRGFLCAVIIVQQEPVLTPGSKRYTHRFCSINLQLVNEFCLLLEGPVSCHLLGPRVWFHMDKKTA
jgi:hypothetical protein